MEINHRKSHTAQGKIYFWTATINNWYPLLEEPINKATIINSLTNLSARELITVYAFVIMPTHLHFIWRLNQKNGKETAKGSFMKFTAHEFKKSLRSHPDLEKYSVRAMNKRYEFWQRDAMGIEIWSRKVAQQKLDYLHRNPVTGKWKLAKDDVSYYYSSARFYEYGIDEFGFLNNLYTVFDGD